jgi:preprotein translocase subunit SecG
MYQVLLIIEVLVALALVITILLQKSEGGALGIGGGGMMSARGVANLLTRATTVLAIIFIGLSLALTVVAKSRVENTSVLDEIIEEPIDDTPSVPEN